MRANDRAHIFRQRRKHTIYPAMSFGVPFFLLALAFAVQSVHPFGDAMILTVDLYHQYAPFLAEFRHKILSGDSLFFSWNIGLGTNFWSIFANYESSPLNFLILLFPAKYLSDGIACIACLRAGLAGLFFSWLIRDIDNNREDFFMTAFATMYALCGWVLTNFWNIMWHDAIAMLPLVILGLRRLMRDRKPVLFCLSLAICVWSNFYAGFFVCLFLCLYAPVCYLSITARITLRNFWAALWRFVLYSGIAGGMTAMLIYPTWKTLQSASATGDTFPTDYSLTQNIFDFLSRFFLGSHPNIRDGMANVYCGVVMFILIPLFFLCTKIRLREKISYGLLLAFMYLSFSNRILNFIWHGMHFPNQIPYRESFIMSFILVIMAYKVLRNLKSFTIQEVSFVSVSALSYLVLYEKFGVTVAGSLDEMIPIAATALFIIAYTVLFRSILQSSKKYNTQRILLGGLILLEVLIATQMSIGTVAEEESFTNWDFYGKSESEVTTFVEEAEASGTGDGFARTEMYPAFISNETAVYHVKGLSVFSSTERESYIQFAKALGFHNNGINGTRNFGLTQVTASLLGINYLIDVNGDSLIPNGYTEVDNDLGLRIVQNTDALSVGYMVSSSVLSYQPDTTSMPFLSTNAFIEALGEVDVYKSELLKEETNTNATFSSGNAQNGYGYTVAMSNTYTEINVKPQARVNGSHLFLYVTYAGSNCPNIALTGFDDDPSYGNPSTQSARKMQIIDIGTYQAGTGQSIKISWDSINAGTVIVACYSIEEEAYQAMIDGLSDEQLEITSYDATHMNGTITANTAGVMLLTIPYDEGWSATVDGKKADIEEIGSAIMGISLDPGTHVIKLTFVPEGFVTGLKITVLSILLFAGTFFLPYLLRKYRQMRMGHAIMLATEAGNDPILPIDESPEMDDANPEIEEYHADE